MARSPNRQTAAANQAPIGIKPFAVVIPLLLVGLVFLPSSAVILAAMIPTLVARLVDTSTGRRLTITVGALNLVGALYFLHEIWAAGHGVGDIAPTLADTFGWLCALLGAGAGWVLFGAMPSVFNRIAAAQTALRLRRISQTQDRLVEQWGESVRGAYAVRVIREAAEEEAAADEEAA